jgi:hypothetical protein
MTGVDAGRDAVPPICRRCARVLAPGRGEFYVVRVEAVADPSPPVITGEELARDHGAVMQDLLAQLEGYSERELLDMVHRRMTFSLCAACYRQWIEDPTGGQAG